MNSATHKYKYFPSTCLFYFLLFSHWILMSNVFVVGDVLDSQVITGQSKDGFLPVIWLLNYTPPWKKFVEKGEICKKVKPGRIKYDECQ